MTNDSAKTAVHAPQGQHMHGTAAESKRPLYLLVALGALGSWACHAGTAIVSKSDGGRGDSTPTDSRASGDDGDALVAADGMLVADTEAGLSPRLIEGPCMEGMQCQGNDPGGGLEFSCHCTGHTWVCPLHDSQGWLTSDLPLPSSQPEDKATCNGADYACTVPDRCGSLCLCAQGQWHCRTVSTGLDGKPLISEGIPDAGSNTGATCDWPPCSDYGDPPPADVQCFTANCFSTLLPSGTALFQPGPGGCAVEH